LSTSSSSAARTRTGSFPIGFRRMWFKWHQDLEGMLEWAAAERLSIIDLGSDADKTAPAVLKRGLRLGSVDLPEWPGMISADAAVRKEAVAKNSDYIKTCGKFGPLNHFTVMLPKQAELSRKENFKYMVEGYSQLQPALEAAKAKIVIEGWPGPGALCCTPESYHAFFKECSSPVFGVNYDPSHLLRMGIDPLRFLGEIIDRVYPVHAKDTELLAEGLYQFGTTQESTGGGSYWRYTIPGHGAVRWIEIFRMLEAAKYQGAVSNEMEDDNFMGSEEAEKNGILFGRNILETL
jgi:sugar phosphate isomerase/epimerase